MALLVDVAAETKLADQEAIAHLTHAVRELREEALEARRLLGDRTLWMVNSTAQGGGVAEMLPSMISMLRELGFNAEWVVIESDAAAFFDLTKRLHNMIHGQGSQPITSADRDVYEQVNRDNAAFLRSRLRPGDVLIVHDPQPMPLARMVSDVGVRTVWRCHIGLDEENDATRAAWELLHSYGDAYERAVFSAPEYIPDFFSQRATVISPAIDPLSPKNGELSLHRLVGILANSALAAPPSPVVTPPFVECARRVQRDGRLQAANISECIGLLSRPTITQVSRWDRLKGFAPLIDAFAKLKGYLNGAPGGDALHRRRLKLVRLVLAGPDPASIQDDPEGLEVFDELRAAYLALDPALQDDVALVSLPMTSLQQNNLMVNAIQRASSIVVQNSLREGFGLTVTEAMWKRVPVLSNTRACGPRQQLRDRIDGRLVTDPENTDELAATMNEMLAEPRSRDAYSRSAQRRVHENFLVTSQLRAWLRLLSELARTPRTAAVAAEATAQPS